jgi:hypothetical protein
LLKRGLKGLRILWGQPKVLKVQKVLRKAPLKAAFFAGEMKKKRLLQLQYIRMGRSLPIAGKKEYATGIFAVSQTSILHFLLPHLLPDFRGKILKFSRDSVSTK